MMMLVVNRTVIQYDLASSNLLRLLDEFVLRYSSYGMIARSVHAESLQQQMC